MDGGKGREREREDKLMTVWLRGRPLGCGLLRLLRLKDREKRRDVCHLHLDVGAERQPHPAAAVRIDGCVYGFINQCHHFFELGADATVDSALLALGRVTIRLAAEIGQDTSVVVAELVEGGGEHNPKLLQAMILHGSTRRK
jgi:hypothetical protein